MIIHFANLEIFQLFKFKFDPNTYETDDQYKDLKSHRGYSYQDLIQVCPEKLEDYKSKLKSFYDEHIHTDEEIRFVLDGSGYFDVRDPQDSWIRIEVEKGDMIVLPAGIYHRFTLDTNVSWYIFFCYIHSTAMLLTTAHIYIS